MGQKTEERPVGGGGWCPLKYEEMKVGIQGKQFTAQKMWDTEPWNDSWGRALPEGHGLEWLLTWTWTASPDKHALCRKARPK